MPWPIIAKLVIAFGIAVLLFRPPRRTIAIWIAAAIIAFAVRVLYPR